MLYPKNQTPALSKDLFRSPTSEYRGTPFWAWNGKLTKETLYEQIKIFRKMGLGGFHMHVRTGMDSPYLNDEFMEFIRFCTETAKEEEMLAWLYDEDRWPSGAAGGILTKDKPENARKYLLFTATPYAPDRPNCTGESRPGYGQRAVRQDNGELLAVYDIVLDEAGYLKSAKRIAEDDAAAGTKWYAYMEHSTADPWFNDQAYIDTLQPETVDAFIESTHEAYAREVGQYFDSVVPAIFTDEPQFLPKETLDYANESKDVFLPWTPKLPALYAERYHEDLLAVLPQLVWKLPDGALSPIPWRYQNLITDLFVSIFCGRIGKWCDDHHIKLTGHVMGEPSLAKQTKYVGDAMRCYRPFGLPGIDMLCDFHEYTTAKQTQSIVHQAGAEGMLSELYGVTGWDCDFRTYKLQGDWQAALGVTVRVPHLAWMTMKGEAKRDYPASISYQSPWWDQYALVEDHFSRLNTVLTRGKAEVKVAVVHPIESYWMYWGPAEQTAALRDQMEQQFEALCETLLFGTIDFDYLCEAELPHLCKEAGNPLRVGEMAYDAVLVPPVRMLRSTTVERLTAFRKAGGKLIFLGDCPDYVDALPCDSVRALYDSAEHVGFAGTAILEALESQRFLDIRGKDGSREDGLIYQLRRDGNAMHLFICNGKNPVSPDVDPMRKLRFTIKGEYALTVCDTATGEMYPLAADYRNGNTVFERVWYVHDSLLLTLLPGHGETEQTASVRSFEGAVTRFGAVPVTLTEPNMLLLDMAEYALDGGDFYPMEEVLRIDNEARAKLGIPLRRKEVTQPYLIAQEESKNYLTLRFTFTSEIVVTGAKLALEDANDAKLVLNGVSVPSVVDGWYVDHAIETVALPDLKIGENELLVTYPIGRRTNLEAMYLLGNFGVRVNGTDKTLTAPVTKLGFGDIVPQGLPFYTGNIRYKLTVRTDGAFTVRVPQYRGGLCKVYLDGKDMGNIAYSPYALDLDAAAGYHTLEIMLYGTRQNGFAQLHHTQGVYFYQSPNSWRSSGDLWSYEYRFKTAGILKSPEIYGASIVDEQGRVFVPQTSSSGIIERS